MNYLATKFFNKFSQNQTIEYFDKFDKKSEKKEIFLELLGIKDLFLDKQEFAVNELGKVNLEKDQHEVKKIQFSLFPNLYFNGYLSVPDNWNGKYILVLHGHLPAGAIVVFSHSSRGNSSYGTKLLNEGYAVLAPDLLYLGDGMEPEPSRIRNLLEPIGKILDRTLMRSCEHVFKQSLLTGLTLPGLRILQVKRCLEYLNKINKTEKLEIGCLGISSGSILALYSSPLLEQIKCVVASCGFGTFKGSFMERVHCICGYIPGILKYLEMSDIVSMIAPRPLFIQMGKKDQFYPEKSVKEAYEHVKMGYKYENAVEKLMFELHESGHKYYSNQPHEWLKRWL